MAPDRLSIKATEQIEADAPPDRVHQDSEHATEHREPTRQGSDHDSARLIRWRCEARHHPGTKGANGCPKGKKGNELGFHSGQRPQSADGSTHTLARHLSVCGSSLGNHLPRLAWFRDKHSRDRQPNQSDANREEHQQWNRAHHGLTLQHRSTARADRRGSFGGSEHNRGPAAAFRTAKTGHQAGAMTRS